MQNSQFEYQLILISFMFAMLAVPSFILIFSSNLEIDKRKALNLICELTKKNEYIKIYKKFLKVKSYNPQDVSIDFFSESLKGLIEKDINSKTILLSYFNQLSYDECFKYFIEHFEKMEKKEKTIELLAHYNNEKDEVN